MFENDTIIFDNLIASFMDTPVFEDGYCLTPEGLHFEAKSARGGMPRSFWETYSSFANTDGGVIALGISEESGRLKVNGVPDVPGTINNLWNTINNREKVSSNLLRDESVSTLVVDGMSVILVDVPRAERRDRPVFIDGNNRNTFRRNGDGDYKCSVDTIASMVSDSLSTVTDRVPIFSSDIDDFDHDTVKAYRNSYRTLKPSNSLNNEDDDEFLRQIGAAVRHKGELRPTLAGLLMFGQSYLISSEVSGFFLDFRSYGNGDDWTSRFTSNDGDWPGNVYSYFNRAVNNLRTAVSRPFALDNDLRRIEDSPMDRCLREAVANAVINADYRGRTGIVTEVRPGIVTVRNSGTFRIPLPIALEGGISDPRNQTISNMFLQIGMVEHAGSGIHRMVNACRESGLPDPEFKETYEPEMTTAIIRLVPESDELDMKVLRALAEDGSASMSTMAESLGVGRSQVVGAVQKLKASGRIARIGGNRGRWQVL